MLLGAPTARLLRGVALRWPKALFLPLGALLGVAWGMGAALFTLLVPGFANVLVLSLLFAGAAGAVQLGWFWLIYAWRRVNRRSTAWVVALACGLSVFLGTAGFGALWALK